MRPGRYVVGGLLLAGAVAVAVLRSDRALSSAPAIDAQGRPSVRVRVEVLNAGGVSGLAGDATDLLRAGGFDVVDFGNARTWTEDSSAVLDRVGQPELADAVARALGIPTVSSRLDSTLYVDVSVLLGPEWAPPATVATTTAGTRPWWDPRGWFGR